jgi:hypothetical protein
MREVGKQFNLRGNRNFRESVRRIHKYKILVTGSFIIGLDTDKPGVGLKIGRAAIDYGMDLLALLFMTPLPGTRLWDQLNNDSRILMNAVPDHWKYFTLELPVIKFNHLDRLDIIQEFNQCIGSFCSTRQILKRLSAGFIHGRQPILNFIANMQVRNSLRNRRKMLESFLKKTMQKDDFRKYSDRAYRFVKEVI